jgi:hypothetical protein
MTGIQYCPFFLPPIAYIIAGLVGGYLLVREFLPGKKWWELLLIITVIVIGLIMVVFTILFSLF